MLVYVAHKRSGYDGLRRAKKITHDLQMADLSNCYVCPLLVFSHIGYEIDADDEMELHLDLLTNCDRLILASEISKGVQMEIDFAKLVKMEVMRLDENGTLRTFTE